MPVRKRFPRLPRRMPWPRGAGFIREPQRDRLEALLVREKSVEDVRVEMRPAAFARIAAACSCGSGSLYLRRLTSAS